MRWLYYGGGDQVSLTVCTRLQAVPVW